MPETRPETAATQEQIRPAGARNGTRNGLDGGAGDGGPAQAHAGRRATASKTTRGFSGVAAVQHAITILRALDGRSPELGVNELARRAGVHNSTASRILSTLESVRFVDRDPGSGRFRIGMGLIALVNPIACNLDVVKLARPTINRLARDVGETTSLGFLLDDEVVMVEQVPGSRAVGFVTRASARVPLHCTAAGKAFLALMPPEGRQAIYAHGLERFTPMTKITPAELESDLIECQRRGYAINDEEFQPESCGIAATIHDAGGAAVAALTMAVPKHRFELAYQQELSTRILEATGELSRSLGHNPPRA